MKNTVKSILEMKQKGEKISMVTCYDYTTATLLEKSNVNMILVGDSLGNTMMGYDNTLPVTLDDMITYGSSVVRGTDNILVVMDMPFMTYQQSVYDAVCNAGRLIKETGAQAVKLEGGETVKDTIKAITDAGIPVNAHVGMTPQSVNAFGGFKVQGKSTDQGERVIKDALAVQEAGAFCVTLESVPQKLAEIITELLDIPTIGIGAGPHCDGQVLVLQDMLGMFQDYTPKFVKKYAELGDEMIEAFNQYDKEVKDQSFPGPEHVFKMKRDVIRELRAKYLKEDE